MKDERIHLGHIRDAISDITTYASVGKEGFLADRVLRAPIPPLSFELPLEARMVDFCTQHPGIAAGAE